MLVLIITDVKVAVDGATFPIGVPLILVKLADPPVVAIPTPFNVATPVMFNPVKVPTDVIFG